MNLFPRDFYQERQEYVLLEYLAKNFKENAEFFRPKNAQNVILVQKNFSGKNKKYQYSWREFQENPRILPRNLGKSKIKREKARGLMIPGCNLAQRQETRTTKVQ